MQLTDERLIRADLDTVWRAILDPEVLKACIPGCESLTGSPEAGHKHITHIDMPASPARVWTAIHG